VGFTPDLLQQGRRFRIGFGLELLMQQQAQYPIDLQRRRIVSFGGQDLHQGALRRFP
jgi:hypothetical protein